MKFLYQTQEEINKKVMKKLLIKMKKKCNSLIYEIHQKESRLINRFSIRLNNK